MEDPADLKDSAPSLSPSDHVLDHPPPKNTSDQEEMIIQDAACTDISDISDTSLEVQSILRWDGHLFETDHDNDVDYFENAHDIDFGIDLDEPEQCVITARVQDAKEEQEASSSEEKNKMMGSPEVVPRVTSPARHLSPKPKMASRSDDVTPSIQLVEKQNFVKCLSEMREIKDELHGLKSLMDKSDEETNLALNQLYDCQMHQKELMAELERQKGNFAKSRLMMIELSSIIKHREKEIEDLRKQVSHSDEAFSDLQESFEKKEYEIQSLNNRLKETGEERLQLKTLGLCLSRTLETLTYTVKNTMTADLAQTRLQTMPTISIDRVMHQRRELAKRLHACIHLVALEFKELYFSRAPDSTTEGTSTAIVPFNITEMASGSGQSEQESNGQDQQTISRNLPLQKWHIQFEETGWKVFETLKIFQRVIDVILMTRTFVEAALDARLYVTIQRLIRSERQLATMKVLHEAQCSEKEALEKECEKLKREYYSRDYIAMKLQEDLLENHNRLHFKNWYMRDEYKELKKQDKMFDARSEKIYRLKEQLSTLEKEKVLTLRDMQQSLEKTRSDFNNLRQLCQRKELKLRTAQAEVLNLTETVTRNNRILGLLRKELAEAKKSLERAKLDAKGAASEKTFLKDALATETKKCGQLEDDLSKMEKKKNEMVKAMEEKMEKTMKEMQKKMEKQKKGGAFEKLRKLMTDATRSRQD